MSFLHPAILSALGLVAIPLLIHLIRRRRQRVIQWAAMEFLRQSQKKQRRKLRIEELILLALRMLIVAVAVLAFARPVLKALGIPLLSQNARVYAVIVLDDSFSMEAKGRDGKTGWERAQAVCDTILNSVLRNGDAVSVVLLSDRAKAEVDAPSFDLKYVGRRIKTLKPGDHATDYYAGAQIVARLLKASKTPNKEVYWITDDQQVAWASSKKEVARTLWGDIARLSRLTWTSVGAPGDDRDNLAVASPLLSRELVTPSLPVTIESQIFNYGTRAKSNVPVRLLIDNKEQKTVQVSIAPGQSATASFPATVVTGAGTHTGRVEIGSGQTDALSRDNATLFALRVRNQIKILVLDTRPVRDPARSESYYLLNAMAPGGAAESLAPRIKEGATLDGIGLREFDAVVIAGVSGLNAADRRALTEYVQNGGGLLLFPGPATDVRRVNADWSAANLLPARIEAKRTLEDTNAITLNPATANHPALALFKDTGAVDLNSARFLTYLSLNPLADPNDPNAVRAMLRFSNGEPAFVERQVGAGRVVLAASSAGATWNGLPLKPAFVPLVYQLLSYLGAGPTARRNLRQGEPLTLYLPVGDANKPIRVLAPDNHTVTQNSVLTAQGVVFTYKDTNQSGLYRLSVGNASASNNAAPSGASGSTLNAQRSTLNASSDAFAVSLPDGESNLAYADPRQSATQSGVPSNRFSSASTPAQLQASVRAARYGSEIWRPFLYALFPMLFLEIWLAQRFGRRG